MEFHKILPELAKCHRVIAVDLRGMGGSAKPGLGYKKNMAKDIHELAQALGYKQVNIAGHDMEQWSPTASLLTIQMRRSKSA